MSIAGHTETLPVSPCGIRKGMRVEFSPVLDVWMRGARYGTVTRVYRYWRDGLGAANSFDRIMVTVRADHPGIRRLVRCPATYVVQTDKAAADIIMGRKS